MPGNPPYVLQAGTLRIILEKIKSAATPARFTYDFLQGTLGCKGGNARAVVPFLKRIGFLGSDGAPTELYKRFRNPSQSGPAMAEAIRIGYQTLYEMDEGLHKASNDKLTGLIVQATGAEQNSRVVRAIRSSFNILKGHANFEKSQNIPLPAPERETTSVSLPPPELSRQDSGIGMNLSYTINLNLPATSDISVFDAIFRSLRENLLKG